MHHRFPSHLAESSGPFTPTPHSYSTAITVLILTLSVLTLLGTLIPLFSIDFEVVLFLRSINITVLEEIGGVGNGLGHGATLVVISVGLIIVGYVWKRDQFQSAGWQSLIVHGITGLIIQIVKGLIGRPRPRFMHQDHWQIGPSLQDGLDTFPSGHSAASFAVAAVLARHFPKGAWIWYGAAAFVAISRIMRGSHFPSDALAGSLIGFLVGYILSRPLKDWLMSLLDALVNGLPYWVGGFALMWITFHFPKTSALQVGMIWVGLMMIVVSLGIRAFHILKPRQTASGLHFRISTANLMLGLGIALYSESLLVAVFTLCAGMAWWIHHSQTDRGENSGFQTVAERDNPVAREGLIGLAIIAFLIGIQQLKGLIPLQ